MSRSKFVQTLALVSRWGGNAEQELRAPWRPAVLCLFPNPGANRIAIGCRKLLLAKWHVCLGSARRCCGVIWRPINSVNIGSAYNYERFDFTRFDAGSTTESSAKVYADWKPGRWLTLRASGTYSERRAGNYDYLGNVGIFQ